MALESLAVVVRSRVVPVIKEWSDGVATVPDYVVETG